MSYGGADKTQQTASRGPSRKDLDVTAVFHGILKPS